MQPTTPTARETAQVGAEPIAARRRGRLARPLRWLAVLAVVAVNLLILQRLWLKVTLDAFGPLAGAYTIGVVLYVTSRFGIAIAYRPAPLRDYRPTVTVVVPGFNEGAAVARTIDACMQQDYPADRLRVVAVDDGSTDDTLAWMRRAAAAYPADRVRVIALGVNRGKRAAMARGIRESESEVLVFVDSDSEPALDGIAQIVAPLADDRVGVVSGIAHARNLEDGVLPLMQGARYYTSFQVMKGAESILNAVTCASGCFAAYRRSAVAPVLDAWEEQTFLGSRCTYGDDRALTNRMIADGWHSRYQSTAESWTDVPVQRRQFFRQQLRWKKSWSRETVLLLGHIWRSRPLALPVVLVQAMTGLLSPFVFAATMLGAGDAGRFPASYLLGLHLVASCYALFHLWKDPRGGLWVYSYLSTFFYAAFSPMLYWALWRIRDGAWGTRPATNHVGPRAAAGAVGVDG